MPKKRVYLTDEELKLNNKQICVKYGVRGATAWRAKKEGWLVPNYHVREVSIDRNWVDKNQDLLMELARIGAWVCARVYLHALKGDKNPYRLFEVEDCADAIYLRLVEVSDSMPDEVKEIRGRTCQWLHAVAWREGSNFIKRHIFRHSDDHYHIITEEEAMDGYPISRGILIGKDNWSEENTETMLSERGRELLGYCKKILDGDEFGLLCKFLGNGQLYSDEVDKVVTKIRKEAGVRAHEPRPTQAGKYREEPVLYLNNPTVRHATRRTLAVRDGLETVDGIEMVHCGLCGHQMPLREATIDHAIPRAEGGKDILSNLHLAHKQCNEKKGSNTHC